MPSGGWKNRLRVTVGEITPDPTELRRRMEAQWDRPIQNSNRPARYAHILPDGYQLTAGYRLLNLTPTPKAPGQAALERSHFGSELP